jgi:hypothetical protein
MAEIARRMERVHLLVEEMHRRMDRLNPSDGETKE